MASLPKHFNRFAREISLNSSRQERIDKAVRRVGQVAREDALAQYVVGDVKPQGSFAQNTVVRPLNGAAEYDVDLVLPMDFTKMPHGLFQQCPNPEEILDYVARRLRANFAVRVEKRTKCVRINYVGDFHIDVVPAHVVNGIEGPFQVCDRSEGTFLNSDPLAMVRWVHQKDQEFSGRFVKGLKMLKRWRDYRVGSASAPSSIILTLLAGRSLEYYQQRNPPFQALSGSDLSMEAFLWDVANAMRHFMDTGGWMGFALNTPGHHAEDMERTWPDEHQTILKNRLDTFIRRTGDAINTGRQETAINRWQENFGNSFIRNP